MAEGHRGRVRDRLLSQRVQDVPEYVVLESYLHGIVPRKDMHALANRLIEEFGTFAQVVDAPLEALQAVEGVGPTIAQKIKLIQVYLRCYLHSQNQKDTVLYTTEDFGEYLKPYFLGERNELVYLLCMNSSNKVLGCDLLGEGGISAVAFTIRSLLSVVNKYNATRVVLAHNHPCGIAIPSQEDVNITRRVRRMLRDSEVELLDHIIMDEDDFVSIHDSGGESSVW